MSNGPGKLTSERLREVLDFNPDTGVFRWKERRANRPAGSIAGGSHNNGYLSIRIDEADYLAARLAWFWTYGAWPKRITFLDKDRTNLRPSNLCEVEHKPSKYNWRTKEGRAAYQLEYNSARREKHRDQQRFRTFGITAAEYQAKLEAQNGVCAICGCAETAVRNGRIKALTVDHNHITNEVRELLCNACNVMVGMSREKPEILEKAAAYLRRHSNLGPTADGV